MTGRIIFDDFGHRTEFHLEVLELDKDEFKKIAIWDAKDGLNYTRSQSEVYTQITHSLQNKTIIVAARLGMPYLKLKFVFCFFYFLLGISTFNLFFFQRSN